MIIANLNAEESNLNHPIQELPTYTVTGTHLDLEDDSLAVPLVRIGAEELELWSDLSPITALRKQPFFYGNANTENDSNDGTGSADVNLRGLGNLSTLTLINGRRAGGNSAFPFQHGGFADLNLIPSAAIREIQIATDGTSVAYGSDAVAGTVNMLLHDRFTGNKADAFYSDTTDGDASEKSLSFLSGQDLGSTHVVLLGNWYQRNAIYARDRDISADTNRRSQGGQDQGSPTFPGLIVAGGTELIRVDLDDPSLGYREWDPSDPGEPVGLFNYSQFAPAIPEQERRSIMANVTHDLSPSRQLWGEFLHTETEFQNGLAPAPWTAARDDPYAHPELFASIVGPSGGNPSPHFPDSINPDDLEEVRYRSFELGNLEARQDKTATRGLIGLRGESGEWNWETAAMLIKTQLDTQWSGIADADLLAESVANGSFNPFAGAFASGSTVQADNTLVFYDNEAALQSAATTANESYEEAFESFDIKFRGPLFELPTGFQQLVVGAEVRREEIDIQTDELIRTGGSLGGATHTPYSADRKVGSFFTETAIPLLSNEGEKDRQALELTLALRFEDYEDKGSSKNTYDAWVYKSGLVYKPNEALKLRASYGTSFRAPTLSESYGEPLVAYYVYNDQATPDYARIPTVVSGNPDLDPEESKNVNIGISFEPAPDSGWHASVDYYRIETEDAIVNSAQSLVDNDTGDVYRNSDGSLLYVFSDWFNAAEIVTDGLAYELSYHQPTSGGFWEAALAVNQVLSYKITATDGGPTVSYLGRMVDPRASGENIAGPGSVPRYKGHFNLIWNQGPLTLGAALNYTHSLEDNKVFTSNNESRKIDSWTSLDLTARYSWPSNAGDWLRDTTLVVGVENVTDELPPFAAGAYADGYDSSLYSLEGRRFSLSISRYF